MGNQRVLFEDANLDGTVTSAEIVEENHYYAFGMKMTGDWEKVARPDNRYRYNGKELNEHLGLYDYGARWYDPTIARWHQVDPLADQFSGWSPYNYVYNNPIIHTDPTGMATDWIPDVDQDGNITYTSEEGDSYNSFVEQYGEEAAEATFAANGGQATVKTETYSEGQVVLSSDEPLALQMGTQEFSVVADVLRQSNGVDQVSNMTDAYKQLKFMAKLNSVRGSQSFDFGEFFSGTTSTMSGTVNGKNGQSTTLTFDMSGDLSNLAVTPNFKQIGSEPDMFNIASYTTVGSSGHVPSLQISLKNYSLKSVLSPR